MKKYLSLLIILLFGFSISLQAQTSKRILVFSKTKGWRHTSIPNGIKYFQQLGVKQGIVVDTTENSENFNETNLKKYNAVVFLNTTGEILNTSQKADFERYIQAGGGFVGVHAAADCEYNWAWYGALVGGYFNGHPGGPNVSNVQMGKMITLDKTFPASANFPETFERKDEFYDFKSQKKEELHFLVRVDENSYKMGKMGDFHPMAWYHEYDGGKAFYSNFGHVDDTFTEPLMAEHFWQGLKWVLVEKLDYSKVHTQRTPEENRFVKTVLVDNLDEPTELAVMPNGKVIFTERKGLLKMYNPATKKTKIVAKMPVYTKFEYGLMGINLDPNFEKNNWLYLYYTPDETREVTKDNFLSRYEYDQVKDTLVFSSEKVLLRVGVKRNECCHTGGSIDFDKAGNLFLSTGDDTNPFASDGFSPHDFQTGREGWDGLRAPANTNDLRGKILRIKPQDDGTYSIPQGNLFPIGTAKTRPEIYVMGCRNPYRMSVDKRTGFVYWGDIGPDAGKGDDKRGPEGLVEFNQGRTPGFYGWPMFTGQNFAYNHYDFEKKISGEKFNPEHPINDSPNNTGLRELPPAQKAWIWYGYGDSKEFPTLGKGGANPMAGPVYYYDDYENNSKKFPKYYDGKFFAYEWMRDWIIPVSMDKNGDYTGMETFMPATQFSHPMDMTFHKDGTMYLLEYGQKWFSQNEDARLSHVEFNAGNRPPIVAISADKQVGALPLVVQFSSKGTMDYDGDALKYLWNFGKTMPKSALPNPKVTFVKAGIYDVILSVTDQAGNKTEQKMKIKAGNAEPKVAIEVKGNKTFFFENEKLDYDVNVTDKEDGTLLNKTAKTPTTKSIKPEDVYVSIDYLEGYDKTMLAQGHQQNTGFMAGKRLMESLDCKSCHQNVEKSIGPSFKEISKKYPRTSANVNLLSQKIIKGGGGIWGEQSMSAHPQLSLSEANSMVEYIMSLNDPKKASLPIKGMYDLASHQNKKAGAYLVQASYTDKGGNGIGSLTNTETIALRSPKINAVSFDESKAISKYDVPKMGEVAVASADKSYIGFKDLDLTGIKSLKIAAFSMKGQTVGGKIEVKIGSPTGITIGEVMVSDANKDVLQVECKNMPSGKQNVYFVFSNPANEGKPLMGLSTIEFINK